MLGKQFFSEMFTKPFLLSIKRSILYENLIQSRMACIKKCEFFRLVRVPFFLRKGGTFYEN